MSNKYSKLSVSRGLRNCQATTHSLDQPRRFTREIKGRRINQLFSTEPSEVFSQWHENNVATKISQLTVEERQTIITLKNIGLSYRNISKKGSESIPSPSKGTQTVTGRGLADTTESEDKFLRVNSCVMVAHRSTASSVIAVVVSKSQLQLWREDFELQVWQDELQKESLSGPWNATIGLLKTGRRCYGLMDQHLKSSVRHAGSLYAVE